MKLDKFLVTLEHDWSLYIECKHIRARLFKGIIWYENDSAVDLGTVVVFRLYDITLFFMVVVRYPFH